MSKKKNLNDGKRRDNQGRALRTGETQRKDGTYEYRFTDINKKRRSIYDNDLTHLRKKEDEIAGMRRDGIDYGGGEITVNELLDRYTALKRGVRYSTTTGYQFVQNLVKKHPGFGERKIRDIRASDGSFRCDGHSECLHPQQL